MYTPLSTPGVLAEAYARCVDAHAALVLALHTPDEATARAAADALAQPDLLALIAYHHVSLPTPQALADLVSAMHADSFARLAELSDSTFNFPNGLLLALRRAWRRHHERLEEGPDTMDQDATVRVFRCATFGEVAVILEDERRVTDEVFEYTIMFGRLVRGGEVVPDAVSDSLDDAFQNLALC
ncbi:hypothetical protein B0H19DRAFT_1255018 [Mycena capillaripes]|nr:hypothetical protein B0H19DRAFT_1255018 [Mycena capillaripes]